ncbi:hypothetical protein C8R46DRAFT_880206, partial [Mycena filopes]
LSPSFLCQICRQWRAIAVSTPDLWRAIDFELFERSRSRMFGAAELEHAKTWLARSGMRPLSIRLSCTPDVEITASFDTLFETLLLYCDRWEYLHLEVPFEFFALVDGNMPLLRALTVGLNEYSRPHSSAMSPFRRAPELRSVLLTESFTTALVLPWAQLTRLESRCLYIYECLSILDAAPQLFYCQFTVSDADPFPPELPTAIVHTGLRHFALDGHDDAYPLDLTDLLGRLSLPALKTLQDSESSISMDALKGFMSRSRCAVDELSVTESSLPKSVYRVAFPSIPSITLA